MTTIRAVALSTPIPDSWSGSGVSLSSRARREFVFDDADALVQFVPFALHIVDQNSQTGRRGGIVAFQDYCERMFQLAPPLRNNDAVLHQYAWS
jgi:hypothetical protein